MCHGGHWKAPHQSGTLVQLVNEGACGERRWATLPTRPAADGAENADSRGAWWPDGPDKAAVRPQRPHRVYGTNASHVRTASANAQHYTIKLKALTAKSSHLWEQVSLPLR